MGTTGCKVVAFDEEGKIVALSYREYPLYYPQTGWIELDAEEVYQVEDSLLEISQSCVMTLLAVWPFPLREKRWSSRREGECLAQHCHFDQRGMNLFSGRRKLAESA